MTHYEHSTIVPTSKKERRMQNTLVDNTTVSTWRHRGAPYPLQAAQANLYIRRSQSQTTAVHPNRSKR